MFATIFSQLWGKPELVELQQTLLDELAETKEAVEREISIDDTHRLVWLHLPPFYSDPAHRFRGVDLPGAGDLRRSELRGLAGA